MNFNNAFRVLLTFNATSLLVIIFLVSADDKTNQKFKISNDDELKLLLYGIEQRFYTTPFGQEKRLANSVIAVE